MEAAPVLWGMPPVVLEAVDLEAEAEAVLERVAVETVVLEPAEGTTEAEADATADEATEAALVMTDEAEALMLETAAEAEDRAAEAEAKAEETALDPPLKGNWPE
jgi:redox-sensitive bicupin YhaK (pirin superfamily)